MLVKQGGNKDKPRLLFIIDEALSRKNPQFVSKLSTSQFWKEIRRIKQLVSPNVDLINENQIFNDTIESEQEYARIFHTLVIDNYDNWKRRYQDDIINVYSNLFIDEPNNPIVVEEVQEQPIHILNQRPTKLSIINESKLASQVRADAKDLAKGGGNKSELAPHLLQQCNQITSPDIRRKYNISKIEEYLMHYIPKLSIVEEHSVEESVSRVSYEEKLDIKLKDPFVDSKLTLSEHESSPINVVRFTPVKLSRETENPPTNVSPLMMRVIALQKEIQKESVLQDQIQRTKLENAKQSKVVIEDEDIRFLKLMNPDQVLVTLDFK